MSNTNERYIHDYEAAHTKQLIQGRRADTHAAFFLPYLSSGMNLLDLGCGPGTITLGLAELISPGKALGVDVESSQVKIAAENANLLDVQNAQFQVGSVYELPFEDNTFDAAFSHAVIEHLSDPMRVLREVHRILKPGGVVGLRSPDWRGLLFAPRTPEWEETWELYFRVRQHLGGDPFVGTAFRRLMRQAGFEQTKATASYETFGTVEETALLKNILNSLFTDPGTVSAVKENGWLDKSGFARIDEMIEEWSVDLDAMFAHPWSEAVGHKP